MKTILGCATLIFVGIAGWQIGGRLSADAIGMALGVLFGIMAGIPASLMVLAARRRDHNEDGFERPQRSRQQHQMPMAYGQYPQQPPVIVVTGQGMPTQQAGGVQQGGYQQGAYQQGGYGAPPGQMTIDGSTLPPPPREFRVVGEAEEVLEPW